MRINRLSKKERDLIQMREKMYVNSWNISEHRKNYDALDDEYATYYFNNPGVKKHLKNYTKIAKKQIKTGDLLRMTNLVQKKFKREQKSTQKYKQNEQQSTLNNSIIKPYEKDLKPKSLQKLRRVHKIEAIQVSRAQSCEAKLPQVQTKGKIYRSEDATSQMVAAKKKMFMEYLEKKRKGFEHQQLHNFDF